MEEALKGKVESPLKDLHGQVMVGGEEFIRWIKGMLSGRSLSHEIIERKRLLEYPSLDEIVRRISRSLKMSEEGIWGKGGRDNIGRKVALYFAKRYTGLSNEAIAKSFGGIHYSAVSKASSRLKEEMSSDRKLLKLVEELDSHFKT